MRAYKRQADIIDRRQRARHECEPCEGKGWRFRVPDGFNPFSAGGWNTINAMQRVPCATCGGTGKRAST